RDFHGTGVQTCALPSSSKAVSHFQDVTVTAVSVGPYALYSSHGTCSRNARKSSGESASPPQVTQRSVRQRSSSPLSTSACSMEELGRASCRGRGARCVG